MATLMPGSPASASATAWKMLVIMRFKRGCAARSRVQRFKRGCAAGSRVQARLRRWFKVLVGEKSPQAVARTASQMRAFASSQPSGVSMTGIGSSSASSK
jgi:hypothetical protein